MSTKVGLFLAAALPPALSSGKPGLVLSCDLVSYLCLYPGEVTRVYLGEPLIRRHLADITVLGDKPRQSAIEKLDLGNWSSLAKAGVLCWRF